MNPFNHGKFNCHLVQFIILGCICFISPKGAYASAPVLPGGGYYGPTNVPLDSWSFQDSVGWTDDSSNAPISFTNISFSNLGDGAALVVNTNLPAWLNYNIYQPDTGATNLIVNGAGSLTFWYAPAAWSSTNSGGTGPGQWTQLIDVGEWTNDASIGYWGLSVDPAGENLWFMSQDGAGNSYSLPTPIAWTTNYFHFIALTYCSTNVCIFIDGQLATNDTGGLNLWPSAPVLGTGVYFGSDPDGLSSAQGSFNSVASYSYPLIANDVQTIYDWNSMFYEINPLNVAMWIVSATNSTTTFTPFTDVITGAGFLQANGPASGNTYGTNAYQVWITNVTAVVVSNGTTAISFTIEGGQDGYMYDVFAIGALPTPSLSSGNWSWLGQGGHFTNYTVAITSQNAFLLLGTPQDTDNDGLTDAYENLVSHSNPTNYTTDGSGMADGWEVLYFGHTGIDPNADPDGDGLSNYQEFQMSSLGYNPTKWNSSTNSVVGDGYQDFSRDGLANLMEAAFGGNMMTNNATWKANFSADGFPDEYKTMIGLSTNSAVAAPGLPAYSKNPIQ